MKGLFAVIILILLISLFSGCLTEQDRTLEITTFTKAFVNDYVPNSITIQFINETVFNRGFGAWDVYGVGTVEYEGNRVIFRYHIYVEEYKAVLKGVLKELKIGDV
jgi:hypothetical protein